MYANNKQEFASHPGDIAKQPDKAGVHPLALVYRGPASCDGCSEAAASLLQGSRWGFEVQYVGPDEPLNLQAATLKLAVLYVQPGGGGNLTKAYRQLENHAHDIQNFVKSGGRYLGMCMGGYLAGATPGFHLLPGDTDAFITSRHASVRTTRDTLVQVKWRDQLHSMYFQDGPFFKLKSKATGVIVLARYTNGKIAALVAPYGKGKVGVVGPHPEADAGWYKDSGLVAPESLDFNLGYDLIDTLML
jgi:glutamine amidotransferase-like uncharacterized protein